MRYLMFKGRVHDEYQFVVVEGVTDMVRIADALQAEMDDSELTYKEGFEAGFHKGAEEGEKRGRREGYLAGVRTARSDPKRADRVVRAIIAAEERGE